MARALGRYELLRPIARGGMAEVFLARRRAGGVEKLLVVKRIRPERATDPKFLELFVREAKLSMSLAHQNIVPVFDFGRAGDRVFLAMERVEGKDLGSSLARAGARPLSPLVAAFLAAECCQALDYAHRKSGVVHRDVTPRNVLLSWSGEVKLTDFGIAALAGEGTALSGTPAYMAPEQARSEPVDARADLYAVGLVLREAVTGQRARPGDDRDSTLARARTGELAPWPPHELPVELVQIIDRATALAPDARFADARAMLAALDAFIVGARAALRGDSPARQLADWLATTWQGEPEEADPTEPISDDLVSLFDDGIGDHTERSLAATVASSPDLPAPLPEARAPGAPAHRSRARLVLPAALALGTVLIVGAAVTRTLRIADEKPIDAAAPVIVPSTDAAEMYADSERIQDMASLDADVSPDAPWPVDAAPPIDAPPRLPRPDAGARTVERPDAGPPKAATRKVRINAKPWATFTIDGSATVHETIETVELTPGSHRIRFTNPELGVTRDVTIIVPPDRDLDHVEDLRR